MQGAQAERADLAEVDAPVAEPLGTECHTPVRVRPPAEEKSHAVILAGSAEHEAECGGARRVEPLHVVDGNEDRRSLRELADEREHRGGDRVRPRRRTVGFRKQQRCLERVALRAGQVRGDLLERPVDEIGQPCERQLRL